jgi:ribosomal protein S18 acetylase RimI-like enzyme
MPEIDINIRSVLPTDRSRLANLIHFGSHIHQHLDWKSPLDWIGHHPYYLMEREGNILATLACPPELPETTWIRLFAVSAHISVQKAWMALWEKTCEELSKVKKIQIAALSLQGWFNLILESSKFELIDHVVVLMCESAVSIPKPKPELINIRPMLPEDLEVIVKVDNSAFGTEWKNSLESLELAYHQSSIATVAENDGEIVGYQYSTTGPMGGHLARLAVATSMQGHGIGYALVYDLLTQFKHAGIKHVTVNTQQKNISSLALYAKAGFIFTGESYRVYEYILQQ